MIACPADPEYGLACAESSTRRTLLILMSLTVCVELGARAELGGANRSEVCRVRAQQSPGRAQVVVELDPALKLRRRARVTAR